MSFFARNKILFAAALGFALLLGAWAALFTLAAKNPVASVPLEKVERDLRARCSRQNEPVDATRASARPEVALHPEAPAR